MLKQWRRLRGMSQLDLALSAEVSSRHVSFLESGRARPSAEMVRRLAEALAMPLRERNGLLVAAGFAPVFGDNDWTSPQMAEIRRAAGIILGAHDPSPALVLDAAFNVLEANSGAMALLGAGAPAAPSLNLVDLVFCPGPVRDGLVNWDEVALYLMHRMREGVRIRGPQSPLGAVMQRALAQPGVSQLGLGAHTNQGLVLLPVVFNAGGVETRWFTTVTSFGAPQDALAEEITIEQFYPA
ncbi:helix-turn-helix domain-containing protein [Devosia epidermidihirudinis]|nr:helix-turn-helix domain-containing protein [Devosia epidermidihirudinis]